MRNDMTQGTPWKTILAFALPVMGSNLLQVLYNFADAVIVGNFIGPTALGAVGLTGSPTWLLISCSVSLGTGTSIIIAQYYGAKDAHNIRVSVTAAYTISIFLSAVITPLCFLIAKPLIWDFLAAPPEMRTMSVIYFCICALGILPQMLYNVTSGILRAHGDSRGGLYFLFAASILNILFDIILIAYFGMGVGGAAAATVFAQACCAAFSIVYLIYFFPELRPKFAAKRSEREKMRTITRVSFPIFVQSAIFAVGFTIMQRFVNTFGTASIEGYTSMGRIENVAHVPSISFNAAVSAFTGQNIGAKKIARAQEGYRASLKMGNIIAVTIAIVVIIFAKPMLGMFNISGESMRRGWEHLILLMIFMPVSTTSNITSGFLQGAGDVKVPAVAGFANLAVRLGATYFMMATVVDFRSVYFSMPPAWIAGCLIVVLRYRSEKWKDMALI
ncbi:MATE family efflux transporter [Synergistaceae bacterium OttesenSCG-928-D05]|nr:MATE family efflux transporter [Synergistaceae bacterium OttesenSCG-928-D05]